MPSQHLQDTYVPVLIPLLLYPLFRFACPFLSRYRRPYQLLLLLSALSHFPSLPLFFSSFSSLTVGDFWEGPADLGSSPCQLCPPTPTPPPHTPTPTPCTCSSTLEHVMKNRAPRELSLGHCVGLCLYSMTFLPV